MSNTVVINNWSGSKPGDVAALVALDLEALGARRVPNVPGATRHLVTFGSFGDVAEVLIDLTPAEAALLCLIGDRVAADDRVDARLTVDADTAHIQDGLPMTVVHRMVGLTP